MKLLKNTVLSTLAGCALALLPATTQADVNPGIPFWGYGTIVSTPAYPIVGEEATIAVTITNYGTDDASDVAVKVSFNDWGATFGGWQEIDTVTIQELPAGESRTIQVTHTFEALAHTCLEALIVSPNDNPNDDRGQINLEVVSADGQFWYQIPVVNNGDEPIDLNVAVHCKGDDTANGIRFCDRVEVPDKIHLEAGEEVLVPVFIDLDAIPGNRLDFFFDVFDPNHPGDPNHRNHVLLRIVRNTARALKEEALATVEGVAAGVTDKGLRNQLQATAKNIRLALDSGAWSAPSELTKAAGAKVFAQEEAALNKLIHLLASDLLLDTKAKLNTAALQLTDADRILAQKAVGTDPVGLALIGEGDQHREAGDYHNAVVSYKHAWQSAQ